MGLLIGIIRRRQLSMMKSNLQWKLHLITAAIATASKAATNLMQVGTDYESDDLISKKLQQRQYKLKLLEEKGFEAKYIQPVDMFCHTPHIESVVLLCKNVHKMIK